MNGKKIIDSRWRLAYTLDNHKLNRKDLKFKKRYLRGLSYIQYKFNCDDKFSKKLLSRYYKELLNEDFKNLEFLRKEEEEKNIQFLCENKKRSFRAPLYLYSFIYDCLLINAIENKALGMRITEYLKGKVSKNEKIKIEYFCKMMYLNENIPNSFEVSKKSLIMWKENRKFFEKDENCVLVTANMSAGKSTLINAIIGKKLALTKNESCTDEIKKYFNKTFEDNRLIKINQEGKIKIIDSKNRDDIESVKEVYTYMNLNVRDNPKLVIIDTPGVNSSIDIDHKYITKKMLESKEYNKVIYVINATNIGSYDDYIHLNEVYKNLNGREIIFVLNKLDMFRSRDDSIDETIYELKKQLEKIGFINPMICPTSAYAAGIFKKLIFSKLEDEDEEDECRRLLRKFSREAFDLNKYYPNKCNFEIKNKKITFDDYSTDEIIECFKRTGIINIQNLITKRFDKSKEVSIEHNPYKVETKITINEKKVVENNELSYEDMKKLNALMKQYISYLNSIIEKYK